MSEDEREVEIDSDDDGAHGGGHRGSGGQYMDKRAHHNALERKRRDHIKESFSGLRDAIPTMQGDKSSRAQILKKASEYISFMRKKNSGHQKDIDDLKRQNQHLEAQIRALERAKNSGQFSSAQEVLEATGLNFDVASGGSSSGADGGAGGAGGGAAVGSPENLLDDEGAVGAAGENGYDASGSDNNSPDVIRQQQQQQQQQQQPGMGEVAAATQQIQIQQIRGGQRVIQVVPSSTLGIRPGQSLLISPPTGQQQIHLNGEPLKKKMKN